MPSSSRATTWSAFTSSYSSTAMVLIEPVATAETLYCRPRASPMYSKRCARPNSIHPQSRTHSDQTRTGSWRWRKSAARCAGGVGIGSRLSVMAALDLGELTAHDQGDVTHALERAELLHELASAIAIAQADL